MTEKEWQDKEIEVLNDFLGKESKKLSTGQVMKEYNFRSFGTGLETKTVLSDPLPKVDWNDLYEIGKRLQEEIKPYRYMLEEGNVVEYLETVGRVLFGKSDSGLSGSEVTR